MACVYAHPLEFTVGNVLPIYVGPVITNAHEWTCYLWWAGAMAGTCLGHCGYVLFGYYDAHDDHHAKPDTHYGGLYVSDWLLGTTAAPVYVSDRKKLG